MVVGTQLGIMGSRESRAAAVEAASSIPEPGPSQVTSTQILKVLYCKTFKSRRDIPPKRKLPGRAIFHCAHSKYGGVLLEL